MTNLKAEQPTPIVLLTIPETAQRLRKSEQALRWMIHKKTAPAHAKIGGRIVFSEAEVDRWVAAQFEQQA